MHSDLFTLLNSWILMLNMTIVSKKQKTKKPSWTYDSVSVPNTLLQGSYKFWKVFFLRLTLCDIIKVGIPFMGTSPAHAHINQSKSESTPINHSGYGSRWQRCIGLAQKGFVFLFFDHKINNVSKGCEGKITLFSFPKNPALLALRELFVDVTALNLIKLKTRL